ncbi:MAG: TolC family protein [Archangiaceae bacterium]|nr:TolC family protein [Archangiaceae bacterium]
MAAVQAAFGFTWDTIPMLRWLFLFSCCVELLGCATSGRDRAWLGRELLERTGASGCERWRGGTPPAEALEDGLDEAEVVAVALCRNPALRAELTRIDAALATLDEARRPANPQLSLMAPIGPITAVATLLVPLESLWQMPRRTEAAARDADVAGEAVLMRALDIVRDARLLHVELGLAFDRATVRAELAQVAANVARLAAVRVKVGDISALDERVLAADALTSADAVELAETDKVMAQGRLVATLALDDPGVPVRPVFSPSVATTLPLNELIAVARAARPDARSASLAISAATARAGWERSRIFNLGALVETQWSQPAGPALRLGGRLDLPIFNQNQGGTGRADAEVERAVAQHELVARTVVMEVTVAHARLEQATRSRQRFEAEVLPALENALAQARRGFETGDQPYLVVLDVLRRVGEARLRRAELLAEQRRALSELERAMGARLQTAPDVASRVSAEKGER